MDINVRIRITAAHVFAWLAWTAGTALVILDVLEIANTDSLGILLALAGTTVWTRSWMCALKRRELVAFDHGRQVERILATDVIRMPAQRS